MDPFKLEANSNFKASSAEKFQSVYNQSRYAYCASNYVIKLTYPISTHLISNC
jgi:hypothetical protein